MTLPCAAADAARYSPGEVIVHYRPGTSPDARANARDLTGRGPVKALPGGSRRVRIGDGDSVRHTLSELRGNPTVRYALPNFVARASAFLPNDPGFAGPGRWHDVQWNFAGPAGIRMPEAWDLARAAGAPGGRGALVAVLDTGVAYANRGRFRRAPELYADRFARGYDFVADDRFPNDENGHGTHVAGTIAQRTNNGAGLTGIAYGARIMPVRVLDGQGLGDVAAIARAVRFAARGGADVINLSLEFDSGVRASQIPDILAALRYAHRKGAMVVAASGNEDAGTVAYPARAGHVISVAATTEHMCRAEYSNMGSGLDIAAPGGGSDMSERPVTAEEAALCRAGRRGRDIYQQTFVGSPRNFRYPAGFQGTSMAAPHVSAVAALVIASKRLGPGAGPDDVQARLQATARDLGRRGLDERYGAGLLDAAAALGPDRFQDPPADGG